MSLKDPIKVYDARWEATEFSDAEVTRLFQATFAYARLLKVDTVTLARDARLAAGRVMEIGIEQALKMGLRVFARMEPTSTPQSYFQTLWVSQEHPHCMGLTITASHNPARYVGVKFVIPPVQAIGQDCGPLNGLTRVRELYHSPEVFPEAPGGSLTLLDLDREYLDFSMKLAGVKPGELSGLKVVLDAFNGSCGPEMYRGLTKAGAQIVARKLVPDGHFPTGSPNPTSQGKMDGAVELAKQQKCHAVIGIDGDGDRIVFGDARGILTAGFAFVPILKTCLQGVKTPVPVLYDPKVSPLALAEWGRLGAQCVLFRNGHSQIKDYMSRINAIGAAEESGHYYHRMTLGNLTISAENSLATVLMFLGALKKQPRLLDELWAMQDQVFTTGEMNYQFADDAHRDGAMDAIINSFKREGAHTQTATDDGIDLQGTCLEKGVKLTPGDVKLENGWLSAYIRASTNEKSVLRSYFSTGEAANGQRVETIARDLCGKQFGGKIVE
jgi:phosphomannomutase